MNLMRSLMALVPVGLMITTGCSGGQAIAPSANVTPSRAAPTHFELVTSDWNCLRPPTQDQIFWDCTAVGIFRNTGGGPEATPVIFMTPHGGGAFHEPPETCTGLIPPTSKDNQTQVSCHMGDVGIVDSPSGYVKPLVKIENADGTTVLGPPDELQWLPSPMPS